MASKLPTKLRIAPQTRLSGRVNVPGSKSLTNRALPLAALAQGTTTVTGALVAEDSEVMLRALQQLGVELEARGETVVVHGAGGPLPASGATLDLRLSGTSLRFLTAVLAAGHGEYVLDGTARMRERPVGDLLDALGQLGADASGVDGRPPVTLRASGLRGGAVRVRGDVSSQFLSGLLMAAPLASAPVSVEVEGELLSKPFVDMTLDVMAHFGVAARRDGYRRFELEPAGYVARDYRVEGDAMAAGYFWAAAAVTGGSVTVCNLGAGTRQGDARFAAVLEQMGCQVAWTPDTVAVTGPRRLRGGEFDLNDMPDQAQTLAVVGLFADAPVHVANVGNLRVKETDRLHAMAVELTRLGARVEEGDDSLTVWPLASEPVAPVELETYGDHRMAMALAVAGARLPNVVIKDPACVNKTYPRFFDDLLGLLGAGLS
ncbi:MAG TPA: 3-phosphoshikimate 1-carboxyvinyltransferase [Trueperaceae bacterium]|nr:3-phosphoshikimate 1-carboxyvinyltransferase [Trueperaceae bacterium]